MSSDTVYILLIKSPHTAHVLQGDFSQTYSLSADKEEHSTSPKDLVDRYYNDCGPPWEDFIVVEGTRIAGILIGTGWEFQPTRVVGIISKGASIEEAFEALGISNSASKEEKIKNPFPPGSNLADCFQWLVECGGKMAFCNNPMAAQLVREGVAEKGWYDSLGRRTLILKRE